MNSDLPRGLLRRVCLHLCYTPITYVLSSTKSYEPKNDSKSPLLPGRISHFGLNPKDSQQSSSSLPVSASRNVALGAATLQKWMLIAMRCPYCKNNQTEVFRTKSLRSKTYRYRRCQFCKAKFRTQESLCVGKAWTVGGRARRQAGMAGELIGPQPWVETVRWSLAVRNSSRPEGNGMWIT